MKIAVFGASGNIGRLAVTEAISRGHQVTAVARNLSRLRDFPTKVSIREGNIADATEVRDLAAGQDVVINATRPPGGSELEVEANTRGLLEGMAKSGVRLLIVGGAASLLVPGTEGTMVIDDPRYLSPSLRHIGQASLNQYLICTEENGLDWAYLSPPAEIYPGKRSGHFRWGSDTLLTDSAGRSRLSMEDLVVALLDEIETPRHFQQRFTVAY